MCESCGILQLATISDRAQRSPCTHLFGKLLRGDQKIVQVAEVLAVDRVPGKDKLVKVTVNTGATEPVTIVTNAANVSTGAKVAVALEGTPIGDPDDGEVVTGATIGGVASQGVICDAPMLGWGSANKGRAAVLPQSCAVGGAPPATKPKPPAGS